MISGTVVGEVWATRKAAGLEGLRLVLVAVTGVDRLMVAIDTLDARNGQEVLVAPGSGARAVLKEPPNRDVLADAALALLSDGEG
jgi:microcompartment protein CcmK/EutM